MTKSVLFKSVDRKKSGEQSEIIREHSLSGIGPRSVAAAILDLQLPAERITDEHSEILNGVTIAPLAHMKRLEHRYGPFSARLSILAHSSDAS